MPTHGLGPGPKPSETYGVDVIKQTFIRHRRVGHGPPAVLGAHARSQLTQTSMLFQIIIVHPLPLS